jgi:hypothetical protein
MNEEQEKFRQIIYHGLRALTAAIVTGGMAMAKPKSKADEIVDRSLEIADALLERIDARMLITVLVRDPPTSEEVSKFFIKEP